MTRRDGVDWQDWFERWERQQTVYIPRREERFTAMLDLVEELVGPRFTAVDLACGTGAITKRVVERFPEARVVAVDLDPLAMAIGRQVIGDGGGRVRWVEGDLQDPTWTEQLGVPQVDAVLSTTAIHWLSAGAIAELYRAIADLLRPGGVFANGDQMKAPPTLARIRAAADRLRERDRQRAEDAGIESWAAWWLAARAEPAFADLFAERDRRFAWRSEASERAIGSSQGSGELLSHTGYAIHHAALLDAGFTEVDTAWQEFDNRILLAVR
ncbi:MAG: trans-aconitate 2-methyltransferase [Dehalococcoidia bacterium]